MLLMLKLVFMGTPVIAKEILEALCQNGYKPSLVVSQTAKAQGRGQQIQASPVEQFANGQKIPVLTTDNINSETDFEKVKAVAPDLILVAAFGQILRDPVLQLPKIACLNVHASLLPHLRGAAPIQRAIWEGDKKTGITIQKMAKKLDTGDILLQEELEILTKDTSGDLLKKLSALGGAALVKAVKLIETGKFTFTPQDESKATYAKKLEKTDSKVEWKKTAVEIERQIRALQPWPGTEICFGETKVKVFSASVVPNSHGTPGKIETDSKSFLRIQSANGTLELLEIQPENRKRMLVKDFLLGFRGNFPYTSVL